MIIFEIYYIFLQILSNRMLAVVGILLFCVSNYIKLSFYKKNFFIEQYATIIKYIIKFTLKKLKR